MVNWKTGRLLPCVDYTALCNFLTFIWSPLTIGLLYLELQNTMTVLWDSLRKGKAKIHNVDMDVIIQIIGSFFLSPLPVSILHS